MLNREYSHTDQLEGEFNRAIWWWHEWEDWGGGRAAFPREGPLYEQPHEWKLSVECVRAAREHFRSYMNAPRDQETTLGEGGEGRGAVGDS